MHKNRISHSSWLTGLLLLWLLPGLGAAQSEDDFLLPGDAFRVSAEMGSENQLIVRWDIADGYYLYQSKFKFSTDDSGVQLGTPDLPPSELKKDDFFGDVQTYRGTIEIGIPVERRTDAPDTLNLKTISQGCADAGLCYPPHTQIVSVNLPASAATAGAATPESALAALSDLSLSLGMDAGNEILPPEEAYKLLANVERGNLIRLRWDIADGTYLYQDKVQVKLISGEGVSLGQYQLPEAEIKPDTIKPDGTIGDIPVYHGVIDLPIPLIRSNTDPVEIEISAAYQGCAEAGVCYPPMREQLTLALPAIAPEMAVPAVIQTGTTTETAPDNTGATAPGDSRIKAEPVMEQDKIVATLAEGNTWLVILTFFGFGLLLSLTPCVFPMIPILSGIIAGQGTNITTGHAFRLSLVYVLAMSVTYSLAGVLAALFGQNLQAAFQNPWILSTFALVFVLLALSMFGFYELQLPSRWQSRLTDTSNRQKGGSYIGVAVMGLLSALIVGPCVAPPLAGALIYIGQTGDAGLGFAGLFALSMGMGAPLLVIGASAGKFLPRAGAWMDTVKAVFGVGLLAVAIVLLERVLPPAVAMVLWGSLMVISAVYMGALNQLQVEASGWDRLWKGLGVVLLIYGALMLVGAAAGGKDTVQPLRGLGFAAGGAAESGELHFKRIKTVADLEREVSTASAAGKPVMLDFYADWCVSCKEMERYTFSDPAVIAGLKDFVLLQADVTANDAEDQALLQGHFGLPGPPSIMFYGRDGEERQSYRVVGFMAADEFASHIQQAVQ
ncbi:MAG: protein-disulfide reductase DsbD [Gammaproteobacteria bacterium]|nr:protein-disulfide reductase DsbD [Gammaproteobacteria bacterium]